MYRNTILLVLFLAGGLLVVVLHYLPQDLQSTTGPTTSPMKPSSAGEFRGICLQLHHATPDHPYERFIDEIARSGANTLCLVIHAFQENASSQSIFIDARKSPSDEHLARLIAHARRRNLRVMIMPVVLLSNRRGTEWRGKINPGNWDAWWKDYSEFILHYARIAADGKVDIFAVGSELISTETQTDRWRTLIRKVREVCPARLTYSANWDHYQVPRFWEALDIVGLTTYFTLAEGKDPPLEQLLVRWNEIRQDILTWQKTVDRPLLFTEVGWPNQVTAAEFPWNYYAATDQPDPELQARCFKAFFETWVHEKAVCGFLIWEWTNYPGQDTDPQTDTSYRPVGKPAMDVIQAYFQAPSPWQKHPGTAATRPAEQPVPTTRPADRP